jgi:predicted short-subunit dehydrogenase-like oxidoreductase (DUF2520 family)
MLSAQALETLIARGATAFSFHPLQTFPRDFPPKDLIGSLRGIWFGVDGDPRALRFARTLAKVLGGKAVEIPPEKRVLYHAACVVASNHLTTLFSVLEAMHREIGIEGPDPYQLFGPILDATRANAERTSAPASLSGPVARGGIETIARHLDAIRKFNRDLVGYYGTMTLHTVDLALRKGSLTDERAKVFRELVASHLSHLTPEEIPQ